MIKNIKMFCKMFYESTFLPITYYNIEKDEYLSFPKKPNFHVDIQNSSSNFLNFQNNPDYFVSESLGYYGFVEFGHDKYCLILGPVFSTEISESAIHSFMKEWCINSNSRAAVTQFLFSIPQLSFNQFINTLAYLNLCINDEVIDSQEHFGLTDTSHINHISSVHTEQLIESKEYERHHNTYYFEKELMQYVKDGDVDKIKRCLASTSALAQGIVADNALRQEKNIFISNATLTTRNAILGGMNIEEAYQLADVYIQECERSQAIAFISNLNYTMLIDFTERVSRAKMPSDMSMEVFECMQYISRHINEPLQVGDVADHIKKSRSYLAKKFKQELGFDISSFIMRCKLEEAKSLLTFSEKSLSEISNYLCFSSQAYFQNVFKKKYGITPTQYRNRSRLIQ